MRTLPTCTTRGCTYLATQGETCLKHRPSDHSARTSEWADYIRKVVDAAPPLSRAQRDRIAVAFAQGRRQ